MATNYHRVLLEPFTLIRKTKYILRTSYKISNRMEKRRIGIVMNGVTGRMGGNQHLMRSIKAIREQGGVRTPAGIKIIPDPILVGRNLEELKSIAARAGGDRYTTDLDAALNNPDDEVFFDASSTRFRATFVEKAIQARKAIYCEKPTAMDSQSAFRLARLCEEAGLKNGVVQDKLWLPGIRKFCLLRDQGFFGQILSVRGEFGYWVFTGADKDQPAQRPSWNNRSEEGGGITLDMLCHWRYLIDNLFGKIKAVNCLTATHLPTRVDEAGNTHACTSDDACYATFECDNGVICQFNSSWTVRVRRDDLLTMQVDGTHGSAMVGLRKCWIQSLGATPRPIWNPDAEQPLNFYAGWQEVPDCTNFENAFKIQWEYFLRHVADDAPFPWTLREGAKGVQLAELGLKSSEQRRWLAVNDD